MTHIFINMSIYKTLDLPIVLNKPWGDIILTHCVLSFDYRPQHEHIKVRMIYGVLKDNGKFVEYENQNEIYKRDIVLDKDDFESLLKPNDEGKLDGKFRNDDVEDIYIKKIEKIEKMKRDKKDKEIIQFP